MAKVEPFQMPGEGVLPIVFLYGKAHPKGVLLGLANDCIFFPAANHKGDMKLGQMKLNHKNTRKKQT